MVSCLIFQNSASHGSSLQVLCGRLVLLGFVHHIGSGVQSADSLGSWSFFNIAAPVVSLYIVICKVGLRFMDKFLEEVGVVAVHARYAWLDEGLCDVVDDLIIQP